MAKIPQLQPSHSEALVMSLLAAGKSLMAKGYLAEAMGNFYRAFAASTDPTSAILALAQASYQQAQIYQYDGRLADAENSLRRAIILLPDQENIRLAIANLLFINAQNYVSSGVVIPAIIALRETLDLRPDHTEAAFLFSELLKSWPQTPSSPGNLSEIFALQAEGKLLEAEFLVLDGLVAQNWTGDLIPIYVQNLLAQSQRALAQTELARAESILRRLLRLWPDLSNAIEGLAVVLYQKSVVLFNGKFLAEAEVAAWEAHLLRPDMETCRQMIELCAAHPARTIQYLPDESAARVATALRNALLVKDVVGGNFIRMGTERDGGYVMANQGLANKIVYSLGVGSDVSWDLDMAALGCQVYLYDHTVGGLPVSHPSLHYFEIGICAVPSTDPVFKTIEELIVLNGHQGRDDLLLKLDIEGAEWGAFAMMSEDVIKQFTHIVGEFHDLTNIVNPFYRHQVMAALQKINRHFQLVHLHPNNYGAAAIIGGVTIYNDYELAFIRRDGYHFEESRRVFPTELDHRCKPGIADYLVGQMGR